MAMQNVIKIICLGTGTSHGVPMIGCNCPVCTSDDPRDRRSRPSILVDYGDRAVLVDTTPELRLQCIDNGVQRVDAVLFTHHHADHVVGIDDLRRFNWLQDDVLPCYASPETAEVLRQMFGYAFTDEIGYPSATPKLALHLIHQEPINVFGRRIVPIPLLHGPLPVLGFRFGAFAYCTDCSEIPEPSMELLRNLDVLVLDAVRIRPHPMHFNLEQAVAAARRVGAKRTYFTHIAHELKHAEINAQLPEGMALAYDGQLFHVRDD